MKIKLNKFVIAICFVSINILLNGCVGGEENSTNNWSSSATTLQFQDYFNMLNLVN